MLGPQHANLLAWIKNRAANQWGACGAVPLEEIAGGNLFALDDLVREGYVEVSKRRAQGSRWVRPTNKPAPSTESSSDPPTLVAIVENMSAGDPQRVLRGLATAGIAAWVMRPELDKLLEGGTPLDTVISDIKKRTLKGTPFQIESTQAARRRGETVPDTMKGFRVIASTPTTAP